MSKSKGRVRQQKGLVDKTVSAKPEVAAVWAPDLENVEHYPVHVPLVGLGRIKGRQTLDQTGRLIEFSIESQIRSKSGAWVRVVRVDTDHYEVHAHYYIRTGDDTVTQCKREVFFKIAGYSDVDRGYVLAEDLLTAKWDENRQRWEGGS